MIPIENLYYLLSYAWEHPLPEAGWREISRDDPRDALNLLATILVRGMDDLVRRGLERGYTAEVAATSQPRGRLLIKDTIALRARREPRLVVERDELTHDTLRNRLLRTTLDALLRWGAVDDRQHAALHTARRWFAEIPSCAITPGIFAQARPARQNRHYRFLLQVCELIHRLQLPGAKDGTLRFRELQRDEQLMRRIFERFVQRFAREHAPAGVRVTAHESFRWSETSNSDQAHTLPVMETDLMLHRGEQTAILDTKYYTSALVAGRMGGMKHRRENLFQLFAYLKNYEAHHPGRQILGALLYPLNGEHLRHRFQLCGHEVWVCTVNLHQRWREIEAELRVILFASFTGVSALE